ncbi:hypothetical protein HDV04_001325 [Boothiomyces sp. JEL0838]|nr:hypothetical protein HDV04_001325 [Boothiomyces sp. JEL0838]
MYVAVSWDWLIVFISFWAAVFGAFTSIEVICHLLRVLVERKLDRKAGSSSQIGKNNTALKKSSFSLADNQKSFLDKMTDAKMTFLNMLIAAIALGACGIWGMHFIGIHSLSFFVIPDSLLDQEAAILAQGLLNNSYYVPLNLNVLYTTLSLFIGVLSVYFGLLTAAWAFGLFNPNVQNISNEMLDSDKDEQKTPVTPVSPNEVDKKPSFNAELVDSEEMSSKFNESPLQSTTEKKKVAMRSNLSIRIPKTKQTALKRLMVKMKMEMDARKYLQKYTFFSLSKKNQAIFVLGGVLTGFGVAGMHYCGMAAMRIENVKMTMNPIHLSLSIIVASVVATVALWILFFLRSRHAVFASSLVMGLAVCSMHYLATAGIIYEYVQGYNTEKVLWEISGFDNELVSAHLAFSIELGILNYVHRFLK